VKNVWGGVYFSDAIVLNLFDESKHFWTISNRILRNMRSRDGSVIN